MKLKLLVKWNQRRKKLQESLTRRGGKYFIFRGSHKNFLRNGAWVLEDSIALFHGRANPFRHFSVGELNKMNVETVPIHEFFCHNLYKGSWEGRDVLVGIGDMGRKFNRDWLFLREIVVAAQMATHTNVHKLLGCCLETVIPVLVYEWVAPQTLEDCILLRDEIQNQRLVIEWKDRLRIAWEISHIIAYLHTAFPRPIIYLNLNPNYVFLSPERAIKLSDFSLCALIPKNEEFAEVFVGGRIGFMAPEYALLGEARESADVYSFGTLLLMLLTGKIPTKDLCLVDMGEMCIYKMIDPTITRNGVTNFEELQLRYSIQTALLCVANKENCRPTMVEVATELMNIIKSPQKFVTSSISKMFQLHHYKNHTVCNCDNDNNDNNDEEYYDCEQNKDHDNDNNDEEYYDCEQNKDHDNDNNDEEYYDCEQNKDQCHDDVQG